MTGCLKVGENLRLKCTAWKCSCCQWIMFLILMFLLSVKYILKVMNFKRLKLVVCQQLLFLRFAHLEAGIVLFTPNTSCHDAHCQHYSGDQTPTDSHQMLSQEYQPVVCLGSKLRPDWFGVHHLDFGLLFRSIRGWKLCRFSKKKKKACDLFWKWVFVMWLLTENITIHL